jgi:GT2 family glycosyltransferase
MKPLLSIVLATHNRRPVLLDTLARLQGLDLHPKERELIVVDNASTDGSAEAARAAGAHVVALERNAGSCAKSMGLQRARAPYILLLDDDSYPCPGSIQRLLVRFDSTPALGAAGFTVHLPDGSQESSALPHVFVGCGVGLRRSALEQVGGLDGTFFMQAEEYDLSFRLLRAGWRVEIFADLQVRHAKTPRARSSERTAFHDARNNLRIVARYLPSGAARSYARDWAQRYAWLADLQGNVAAHQKGVAEARAVARAERRQYAAWRLGPDVFERFFRWREVERRFGALRTSDVRRIVLADLGKNIYAFWRGARVAGVEMAAIADDRFAQVTSRYRGIPVCRTEQAIELSADAWVISNMSYVHAGQRHEALRQRVDRPLAYWFPPPTGTLRVTAETSEMPARPATTAQGP